MINASISTYKLTINSTSLVVLHFFLNHSTVAEGAHFVNTLLYHVVILPAAGLMVRLNGAAILLNHISCTRLQILRNFICSHELSCTQLLNSLWDIFFILTFSSSIYFQDRKVKLMVFENSEIYSN